MRPSRWAYGVTTVPSRRDNLLPITLGSLRKAGFDKPRLARDAMDAPWMTLRDLSEAIPPPYTRWIGARILERLS